MDPYVVLGASRDDDPKTIKKKYRKRANAAHPDKGGSDAEFHRVRLAYELITNPVKRKLHEQGFSGEETVNDIAVGVAQEVINHVLDLAVQALETPEGFLMASVTGEQKPKDLVKKAVGLIDDKISEVEKEKSKLARHKKAFQKQRGRVSAKQTSNYFEAALDEKLVAINAKLVQTDHQLKVLRAARDIVKRHKDERPETSDESRESMSSATLIANMREHGYFNFR